MPATADEDSGSLDSMWMDPSQSQSQSGQPGKSPSSAAPETPEAGSASGGDHITSAAASAPMCSFDTFKASAIVTRGGWPGVGPFKPRGDEPSELVDDRENLLKVAVAQNQVTKAQLNLVNKHLSGQAQHDLLDMQMTVDFLLEAVGIRPKKIADLNSQLEKNRDALLRGNGDPLNLTTGRYLVTIEKHKTNEGGGVFDYAISVNSLDASRKVIKEHSGEESLTPATAAGQIPQPFDSGSQHGSSQSLTKPPVNATGVTPAADALKEQFACVIRDWQKIKKAAVRSRQVEELSSILAGKALIRQSDAVKWLVTNHKYYEMNPKGVVVDKYAEITPSRKYAVFALVKEASKFIDEGSGQVLKESDDTYKVNYTIEKIGGRWLITDSALLSSAPSAQPNKVPPVKVTR